jgi:radical SAM protein with 4Fe4S-binding SPASM domain
VLTNFSGMTEEAAEWLAANDVRICTSLDGPAALHDANRKWKHGSTHADVVRWLEWFQRRSPEEKRSAAVESLFTVTRQTLSAWRDVVDEYVRRGLRTIRFRPLHPAYARSAWPTIGYGIGEYLDTYRQALDYIVELNRNGTPLTETMAATFVTRILTMEDPGTVDLCSPNGAGTAEWAYDTDGRIFPCEDALLVDGAGDPMFELGHVGRTGLGDLLRHPTVRSIAAASLLDALPMCSDCWNKPFCGVDPVYNYVTQGDLFAQRPHSWKCKEHMAVSARLFELLAGETEQAETLRTWAATAGSEHAVRISKEAP